MAVVYVQASMKVRRPASSAHGNFNASSSLLAKYHDALGIQLTRTIEVTGLSLIQITIAGFGHPSMDA